MTFAALLTAVVILLFPIRFDVADDHSATEILSGSDGFTATADIPFMSRPLAAFLYFLYQLQPHVPWWGIAVYLTTASAIALLARVLLFEPELGSRRVACLAILLPLFIRLLYRITFTSAALLLEVSGFVYLFVRMRQKQVNRWTGRTVVLTTLVAYAWRWKLALYFLAFSLPCIVRLWTTHQRGLRIAALVVLSVVVVDRGWNTVATGKEDRLYQTTYRLRGQFHDLGFVRPNNDDHPALQAAGWNLNDYRMFHDHWMLYDSDKLTAEKLRLFLDSMKSSDATGFVNRTRDALRLAWNTNRPFLLVIAFGMAALFFSSRTTEEPQDRSPLAVDWSWLLVLLPLGVLLLTRFLPRVSLPAIIMCVGVGIWSLPPFWRASHLLRGSQILACCLGFLASAQLFWTDWQTNEQDRKQHEFVQNRLAQLPAPHAGSVIMRMQPGFGFMASARHPLRRDKRAAGLKRLPSGWQVGSRRFRAALQDLGCDSSKDLLLKSVDNEEFLWVLFTPPSFERRNQLLTNWRTYLKENVDPTCRLHTLIIFNAGELKMTVYKFGSEKRGKRNRR